jgi:hypothetical protein
MRRLPAVLLASATAVPVLLTALSSPSALAVSLGRPAVGEPGTLSGSAALPAPPAGLAAGPAGSAAGARPVATKVRRVLLSGVDAEARAAMLAQESIGSSRVAPGAVAAMATSAPAILTKRLDTAGFQTLGVTWKATATGPNLLISIRTRNAAGWSGWDQLDDDNGDDPVAGASGTGVRGGTGPLWVGPSTGVQARIVVRSGKLPAGLALELVDAGTSNHDATASAPPASMRGAGGLAAASVTEPAVISRAQWGADESRVRYAPTPMPTIKATVLHHTAGRNNYSASQVPSIIRGDYAYHLSRGWSDIGYNALVDRFGRIWEGRAGGLDRAIMGAHAGGFNTDTFGVSMIGNYDVTRPSAASIAAVAKVMAWKLDLYHRDPNGRTWLTSAGGGTARYRAGRTVSLPVIMGHRDTGFTACPGRYVYPYLGSIRAQVQALMKAALLDPISPPASVRRGNLISIRARALVAQSWRLSVTAPVSAGWVARTSGSAPAGGSIKATWNGRLASGALARPGRYRLTLTSGSAAGSARPVVADVLIVPPPPVDEIPATPSSGAGGYVPVTPTRLLDTRTGGRVGLGPNGRVDIPVLGVGGVPTTGVTSVVLNLTASAASDDTALRVWPTGQPTKRILTGVPAGLTRSVLVTTRVGGGGAVSVGNSDGVTELTVDVVGYFAAGGSALRSIAPTRIYRSLTDPAGKLTADQPRSIPLPATLGGIPATQITGLVVDVSVLTPAGAGTLTAYRPGTAGNLPTLSYRSGESIDNLAFVEVSGGTIALRVTGAAVDAVLDVRAVTGPIVGGSTFTPVKPVLAVDTRTLGGALGAGAARKVVVTGSKTGVPIEASAVVVDLTGLAPARKTWLRAYTWGQSASRGTALRVAKGEIRGNLVVVPLGPDGSIAIENARGSLQVRVDVYGYLD